MYMMRRVTKFVSGKHTGQFRPEGKIQVQENLDYSTFG